jgi:cobalt-zinc-cadmium efflux system outer membrane protein
MHSHLQRAVALTAALLPAFAQAAPPLTLEQALNLAVQRSEAARSARAGALSAAEAAHAAGQLPDPTLQAGIDNLPITGAGAFRTTSDSMTMKRIGISQEWLSSQKRAARQAAAKALSARDDAQAQAAVADARLQTALAYVDAFYAKEALKLTSLMEHHAHEELEASKARVSSATGNTQDVLALASARGMAEDDSDEVRQQQSEAVVALARWVGMPVDELAPPVVSPPSTETEFVSHLPALVAMRRDVDATKQAAAVAASERTPSWTWQVSYGQRTGYSDMVSVGVSIPLQVAPAQRQDRTTASKLALVEKAEADLAEATRAASAEYESLLGDVQRLQQRIARYRTGVVVPALQRIDAATAGYASNQASLATLFEARHREDDAERKLLALQRDLAKAQVQLAFKPLMNGGDQ